MYVGHFKLLKMKIRLLIEIFRLRIRIIFIYEASELLKTTISARDEKLLAIICHLSLVTIAILECYQFNYHAK